MAISSTTNIGIEPKHLLCKVLYTLTMCWMHTILNHVDFLHSIQSHVFVYSYFPLDCFSFFAITVCKSSLSLLLWMFGSCVVSFINIWISTLTTTTTKTTTLTAYWRVRGYSEDRLCVGCAKMSLWQLIVWCVSVFLFLSISIAIHFNYIAKPKWLKCGMMLWGHETWNTVSFSFLFVLEE